MVAYYKGACAVQLLLLLQLVLKCSGYLHSMHRRLLVPHVRNVSGVFSLLYCQSHHKPKAENSLFFSFSNHILLLTQVPTFLLTKFQPDCASCMCMQVFVYAWPDLPLQTSYLGRCSSLHLLWSCSKPWRSPESSPGLDQSSTRLEKWRERGAIREQHIWFEVYTWLLEVEAMSHIIRLVCYLY